MNNVNEYVHYFYHKASHLSIDKWCMKCACMYSVMCHLCLQTPKASSLSLGKASAHTQSLCTESNLAYLIQDALNLLKPHLNVTKQKHLKGYWMHLYHFFCSVGLYSDTRASAVGGTVKQITLLK